MVTRPRPLEGRILASDGARPDVAFDGFGVTDGFALIQSDATGGTIWRVARKALEGTALTFS